MILGQIRNFVEVVAESQVIPPVATRDSEVDGAVRFAESIGTRVAVVGVVKTVVELGQAEATCAHQPASQSV